MSLNAERFHFQSAGIGNLFTMVTVGPVFNVGSDKILENLHQKDTKLVGFQVHFVNVVAQLMSYAHALLSVLRIPDLIFKKLANSHFYWTLKNWHFVDC